MIGWYRHWRLIARNKTYLHAGPCRWGPIPQWKFDQSCSWRRYNSYRHGYLKCKLAASGASTLQHVDEVVYLKSQSWPRSGYTVASHRKAMSALLIRYSLKTALTSSGERWVSGTVFVILIPPFSFFLKVMFGGSLLRRMPNPSNSVSMILLCVRGLLTSRTMNTRLQVRATAITWRPRP
jgi:hypothetical protein